MVVLVCAVLLFVNVKCAKKRKVQARQTESFKVNRAVAVIKGPNGVDGLVSFVCQVSRTLIPG